MNLLFIIGKYPDYGGVERLTTLFANRFIKDGHKVYIASFEQNEMQLLNELNKNIDLIFLKKPVLRIANIKKLRNLVIARKIDIIINQWCLPYYITLFSKLLSFGSTAKCVFVYHNTPQTGNLIVRAEEVYNATSKNTFNRLLKYFQLQAIKSAVGINFRLGYFWSDRYVLYVNSFGKEFMDITKLSNIPKMRYIPNPLTLDNSKFNYCKNQKKKWVIWVGRLENYQKRIDRVIDIWSDIEDSNKEWSLMIIGNGPDRAKLQNMVSERQIPRVCFEGFQSPIPYMEQASVLLLTSDFEGFGLVIVEAMSFGVVPVVYNSYTAVTEIIEDENDGYAVPAFNKEIFKEKLEYIMQNDIAREKMAIKAMSKSECFSLEKIIVMWYDLFAELKNS